LSPGRSVAARRWIVLLVLLVAMVPFEVAGVDLGDVEVTLHSRKYYPNWDMTRFQYKVVTDRDRTSPDAWILEIGDCILDEAVNVWASSKFTWVDEPFRGLRFEITKTNQTFYLWLTGPWDAGSVGGAVVFDDDDEGLFVGEVSGPFCSGSSISIDVIGDANVAFPPLGGPGTYPVSDGTRLLITSTSAGWTVTHTLGLSIPPTASQEVVSRILRLMYTPYEAVAGTTTVNVSYALVIEEEDLSGLPEGSYRIDIIYTASTD